MTVPDTLDTSPVPAARLLEVQVRTLSPAYFGMVIATGIVSLAANQVGLRWVAWLLFAIAVTAYVVLWMLTILRIWRHPRLLFIDMIDHLRGPGSLPRSRPRAFWAARSSSWPVGFPPPSVCGFWRCSCGSR